MMRKGHLVTRGLDWKWGNQGGHAPGVILKVMRDEGVVHVKWDNDSTVNMYRMGAENKYDLKLVDPDQCVGKTVRRVMWDGCCTTQGIRAYLFVNTAL